MKLSSSVKMAALVALTASVIAPFKPVTATNFDEFAVDQNYFIAVAVPYNYRKFRLAIIEQVPGQQPCWRESGSNPTTVDLLLLNFDHTNSCRKAVDTNGYSLRVNGKDDKVAYTLNLVQNNGELQLVADHQDPREADLVVGRTSGLREAPIKINLDPNWKFTKRLYQEKAIQHIYVSNSPNPRYVANIDTLPTTNDPAQANYPTNNPSQPTQASPPSQPTQQPVATQPVPTSPPQQTAQTDVEIVQGLVSSILTPLTQAVYQTYNTLFAPTPSTLGINQYQAASGCNGKPGMAIWSDTIANQKSDPTEQESQITADGILQLNNGTQIDIKPTLSNNNINPNNFLAGKNSAELDFDGDGQPEGLKIVQPPEPCNTSATY